jgi:hypothetical protein
LDGAADDDGAADEDSGAVDGVADGEADGVGVFDGCGGGPFLSAAAMAANSEAAVGSDNREAFTYTANGPAMPRWDATLVICWVSAVYCPLVTQLRNCVSFFDDNFIGAPNATSFEFVGPGCPGAGCTGLLPSEPNSVS